MMLPLMIGLTLTAQAVAPGAAAPPVPGDACAAIARAVTARMGPAAVMRACDAADAPGHWIEATPDMSARVGEWSWFTLTGDRTGTRVKALVEVDAPFVRAAQPLTRGRVLVADDLVADTGSVAGARFARLLSESEVTGARVMRILDTGAVLQVSDVVIPPLVKAGESVTAVVRIGAVEVTAEMTAIDAGALGDEIRIAHADRKRMLRGRIVGPGRVEVLNEN